MSTPSTEPRLTALLRSTWFGAELPGDTLDHLAAIGEIRQVPAETSLLTEGAPTDELGVLVEGRIALRTLVPERGMVTLLTVEPGDIYGWSALVPPHRSTSTAVAVEAVTAIAFDGARLRAALATDLELATAVYPRVLEAVSRRLVATRLQLLDLFGSEEIAAW